MRCTSRRGGIGAVAWLGLVLLLSLWYYWPSLRWPATFHAGARGGRPVGTGIADPGDTRSILLAVGSIRGPRDVTRWFTGQWYPGASNYYRPVTLFSTWLDYAVWGDRALGYRLHNLLLQIANALLLGLVVMRIARSFWPGAAASLAVALSGTASAATTWVAGRGDLLAAFFFLAALNLLLAIEPGPADERQTAREPLSLSEGEGGERVECRGFRPSPRSSPFQGEDRRAANVYLWPLAVVAFLLALGSKEIAVALPALVTAWMFLWPRPLSRARRVLIALSLWAALGAFWLLRTRALGTAGSAALDFHQLTTQVAWRNYAQFLARPLTAWYYELPWIGWLSLLTPGFWVFILYEAAYWGCAALLFITAPVPTVAFVLWKAIVTPPILAAPWFFAWAHYWYLPSMGSAALTGLVVWRVPVALAGWWRGRRSERGTARGGGRVA